jgi:hypothetical protein
MDRAAEGNAMGIRCEQYARRERLDHGSRSNGGPVSRLFAAISSVQAATALREPRSL